MMATSLDDVWAWPEEPCEKDTYIKWRVEGAEGMAQGTIGWPQYPAHCPSTFEMTCKAFPHEWIRPSWDTVWFPDAFQGTMASLLHGAGDFGKRQHPHDRLRRGVLSFDSGEADGRA